MTRVAILVWLCACLSLQASDLSNVVWKKVNDDDGIHLYEWSDPQSELFAFKVEGRVDAPLLKVASILVDVGRRKDWVHNLDSARILRWVSPTERIEYAAVATPFVIKDRDFVLDAKAAFDPLKHALVFSFHSIQDPSAPKTDKVRGEVMDSDYLLKETADHKGTWLEHRMHIDPKGSVAKWIVNIFQRGFPRKTFEAIRKQAARDDIPIAPEVKKLFR